MRGRRTVGEREEDRVEREGDSGRERETEREGEREKGKGAVKG